MFTEIEAKLKVDSLQEVEDKLLQLDAEFVAEQFQADTHFDDGSATLKNTDSTETFLSALGHENALFKEASIFFRT